MEHYLRGGKRAVWPHVTRIRHMLALETTLAECWNMVKLHRRRKAQQSLEGVPSQNSLLEPPQEHEPADSVGRTEDIGWSDPDDDTEQEEQPVCSEDANAIPSPDMVDKAAQYLHHREQTPVRRAADMEANMDTHYRQLEWEYRRLQTRFERLRSENVDLRRRLEDIRSMCAPSNAPDAS